VVKSTLTPQCNENTKPTGPSWPCSVNKFSLVLFSFDDVSRCNKWRERERERNERNDDVSKTKTGPKLLTEHGPCKFIFA